MLDVCPAQNFVFQGILSEGGTESADVAMHSSRPEQEDGLSFSAMARIAVPCPSDGGQPGSQ